MSSRPISSFRLGDPSASLRSARVTAYKGSGVLRSGALRFDGGLWFNVLPSIPSRCGFAAVRIERRFTCLFLLAQVAQDAFKRLDDFVALHARFTETQLQIELLRRRPIGKHVMLGTTGLGFSRRFAELLPGRAALARHFFD